MTGRLYCLFLILFISGLFLPVLGQSHRRYEIGFQNDNDAFLLLGQDRYYTNGLDIYLRKAVSQPIRSEKVENKIRSLHIGQKIYNAHSGSIEAKEKVDRPITGYLYASGEMKWFLKNEDVISFGGEVAVIGPKAYGRELQEWFHHILGFYEIKGWQYQLNNAVGIDLNTSYSHRVFRTESEKWDGFLNANLFLGLNNTRVAVGPSFRYGRFNRMFESAERGGRVSSKINKLQKEAYVYYRPQINWVIYNSTIQGGMLIENKGPITYGVMPFVLSQVIGFQWNPDRIGLNINYTFNTKEVKSEAVPHQYGSLSFAYYF